MAADDQNNDEYHFADLDVLGTEQETVSLPEDEMHVGNGAEGVASPPGRGRLSQIDPAVMKMIQKGLIAVGVLVFVLIVYKFIGSFFSADKIKQGMTTPASVEPTPQRTQTPLPISTTESKPTTPVSMLTGASDNSDVAKLREDQTRIENELSAMRTQINTMTQNMSDMATKMNEVKQAMLVLSERLEQQSNQMARLQMMGRPRSGSSSSPRACRAPAAPMATYSIQAIIPGRAWLMSSQGRPLTVSQGSMVPGYGTVRLINAEIGRVFTSSGRVIRFSQADS